MENLLLNMKNLPQNSDIFDMTGMENLKVNMENLAVISDHIIIKVWKT